MQRKEWERYGKRQVSTHIFHNGPISMNGNTSDSCTCLFNTYPFTSVSINSVNNYGIIYSDLKLSPSCGKKRSEIQAKGFGNKTRNNTTQFLSWQWNVPFTRKAILMVAGLYNHYPPNENQFWFQTQLHNMVQSANLKITLILTFLSHNVWLTPKTDKLSLYFIIRVSLGTPVFPSKKYPFYLIWWNS